MAADERSVVVAFDEVAISGDVSQEGDVVAHTLDDVLWFAMIDGDNDYNPITTTKRTSKIRQHKTKSPDKTKAKQRRATAYLMTKRNKIK